MVFERQHEDINLITILCAATESGLQAQDTKGDWHDIECNPGNITVNTEICCKCAQIIISPRQLIE